MAMLPLYAWRECFVDDFSHCFDSFCSVQDAVSDRLGNISGAAAEKEGCRVSSCRRGSLILFGELRDVVFVEGFNRIKYILSRIGADPRVYGDWNPDRNTGLNGFSENIKVSLFAKDI